MNILHVGPATPSTTTSVDRTRIELLAHAQREQGHLTTVIYPQHFLSLAQTAWRKQPDTIHVHGWSTATHIHPALLPKASRLWTISDLPPLTPTQYSFVCKHRPLFTAITAPTRALHYRLSVSYQTPAHYIPDTYPSLTVPNIKLTQQWGVRRGQYCVTTATTFSDIEWVAKAYSRVKTSKKLFAVVSEKNTELFRLVEYFPFLRIVETTFLLNYLSFIQQAAVVIATNPTPLTSILFHALQTGRAIVATKDYTHTELLGSAAQYVKKPDIFALATTLSSLVSVTANQKEWGAKATKRATTHFNLDRIVSEYGKLYTTPQLDSVPVDSIVKKDRVSVVSMTTP